MDARLNFVRCLRVAIASQDFCCYAPGLAQRTISVAPRSWRI